MRLISRRLRALALALAGLVIASTPASAQWSSGILTAPSNSMLFEFVSREATFTHHLGIFDYNGGNPVFLSSIFTAPPDMPGATRTVSLIAGNQYVLGLYSPDAQSCFIWCVSKPTTFFSDGSATPSEIFGSSNFDFGFGGGGLIGIEDKRDGLFGNSDNDYNDMVIRVSAVTATPEPATLVLMASGLLALGGMGIARRRRGEG